MTEISIVIPIYNAKKHVKKLLKSLNKNFNFSIGEVILIDDCSKTDTAKFLDEFVKEFPQYKLFHNEKNLGFPGSCNRGMQLSVGDVVVLLNSDTWIPEEFCERIIKCFKADSEVGIASPLSTRSSTYWFKKPFWRSLNFMNKRIRERHECSYPILPHAEGFCFCIRRAVIEQQGMIDEIYGRGYHEEVDFAFRSITNGWKNVLIDDLYVGHRNHSSFGKKLKTAQVAKNDKIFKERWDGFYEKFTSDNNWVNPIIKIKEEVLGK